MEKRKRGRPPLTEEAAAARAVLVIEAALALRLGGTAMASRLEKLGLTELSARRLVNARHRGKVGDFIGASVRELLLAKNPTQAGVRMVLEHQMTVDRAVEWLAGNKGIGATVDRSNLAKAVKAARRISRQKTPQTE